jgi:hypothetical protein
MTEEDYPELPAAKKVATASQSRQAQQPTARENQRQQQLNDINIKLQQLSLTAPSASQQQQ